MYDYLYLYLHAVTGAVGVEPSGRVAAGTARPFNRRSGKPRSRFPYKPETLNPEP